LIHLDSSDALAELHLATAWFVRAAQPDLSLATYDRRMGSAAAALGFPLFAFE
jgi:hypothetical protein